MWYLMMKLGGYITDSIKTDAMYSYEKKINEGDYYYKSNPNSYTHKIELIYANDYDYSSNSNCLNSYSLSDYDNNTHLSTNWLNLDSIEWLLPQTVDRSFGQVDYYNNVKSAYAVCLVLYLNSSAKITDGSGTIDDQYQLSI